MDLENLLNNTLEEFLLQCIIDKIEDISELPKMLKGIGYLDRKEEYLAKQPDVRYWILRILL